jgi:hypothetical protein
MQLNQSGEHVRKLVDLLYSASDEPIFDCTTMSCVARDVRPPPNSDCQGHDLEAG